VSENCRHCVQNTADVKGPEKQKNKKPSWWLYELYEVCFVKYFLFFGSLSLLSFCCRMRQTIKLAQTKVFRVNIVVFAMLLLFGAWATYRFVWFAADTYKTGQFARDEFGLKFTEACEASLSSVPEVKGGKFLVFSNGDENIRYYAGPALAINKKYCEKHGYSWKVTQCVNEMRDTTWAKVPVFHRLLANVDPAIEWVVSIDTGTKLC
jgi:hypothetical protein